MEEKVFAVKFIIRKEIQTQIQSNNVSAYEAIGLLEMAKDQMMDSFRKNTKNVFKMQK